MKKGLYTAVHGTCQSLGNFPAIITKLKTKFCIQLIFVDINVSQSQLV